MSASKTSDDFIEARVLNQARDQPRCTQRSEPLKTVTLKNHQYAQRARRRFCKGTCFVAPVDLVLTGKRTLEEWARVLAEERDLALQAHELGIIKPSSHAQI
jgi:hypothetical protein